MLLDVASGLQVGLVPRGPSHVQQKGFFVDELLSSMFIYLMSGRFVG